MSDIRVEAVACARRWPVVVMIVLLFLNALLAAAFFMLRPYALRDAVAVARICACALNILGNVLLLLYLRRGITWPFMPVFAVSGMGVLAFIVAEWTNNAYADYDIGRPLVSLILLTFFIIPWRRPSLRMAMTRRQRSLVKVVFMLLPCMRVADGLSSLYWWTRFKDAELQWRCVSDALTALGLALGATAVFVALLVALQNCPASDSK